jgi:cell division protein ZapA
MARLTVSVNSRSFALTCADGQEARICRLAEYVDAKVAGFVAKVGQVGEAKLLLLAALVIADELAEANEAFEPQHERPRLGDFERPASADLAANGAHDPSKPREAIAAGLRSS